MKKRVFTMVLAFLLVFGVVGGMAKQEASAEGNEINQVRESVVVVATYLQARRGGELGFGYGTGFFVGNEDSDVQYLVTNHHVIEHYLNNGAGEETSFIYTDTKERFKGKMKIRVFYNAKDYEEAYVVDYDKTKDIALLTLDKPTDKRKALKLCQPEDSMVGSDIYAIGYPGLSDNEITDAVSNWEIGDASITAGIISRLLTTAGTGVKLIQTDATIQSGNSGGPMVNESGVVVGVNSSGVIDRENQEQSNYAVNINEVIPMLKMHDVEYQLGSDSSAESDADNQEGAGDAESDTEKTDLNAADTSSDAEGDSDIVSQASESEPSKSDNQAVDASEQEKDGGMGMLPIVLIAGVIVLVILVAAVLVIVSRKKKPSQANSGDSLHVVHAEDPKRIPQSGFVGNPAVRSLSSQHNGATYQLNGRQILLGRDMSNCTVIFREGTPGVSNRHCSVAFDENTGEFIVTDLKSSYGTFLADGQRMKQGVAYRLKSGDQFYLGSNENLIQVEL